MNVDKDRPGIPSVQNKPVTQPSDRRTDDSGMRLSMHDGVEVWCDCCSCEAEPYWVEAFAQQDSSPHIEKDRAPPR